VMEGGEGSLKDEPGLAMRLQDLIMPIKPPFYIHVRFHTLSPQPFILKNSVNFVNQRIIIFILNEHLGEKYSYSLYSTRVE